MGKADFLYCDSCGAPNYEGRRRCYRCNAWLHEKAPQDLDC